MAARVGHDSAEVDSCTHGCEMARSPTLKIWILDANELCFEGMPRVLISPKEIS